MGALGQCLHEMRARRGLTLDEIAQVTRIGKRHLVALEAEDFSELPAPVFVKGFLRSYCDALQEPCDEALGLYRQTIEATAPCAPPIASGRLGHGGAASARRQLPARSRRRVPLVAVAALLVLLGLAAMAVQLLTRRSQTAGP